MRVIAAVYNVANAFSEHPERAESSSNNDRWCWELAPADVLKTKPHVQNTDLDQRPESTTILLLGNIQPYLAQS
jgi:hypothetical protein